MLYHMYPIYIHEYKIAIWWSAKCGFSTIKTLIFNNIYNKNELHENSYVNFDPKYLNYKNILIVRNPINRFISCYNHWFPTFCNMYKLDKNLSFKEFLEITLKSRNNNLKKEENVSLNHHLTDQFSEKFYDLDNYCKNNNINFKFDKIIKLEEFNSIEFMKNNFNYDLKSNVHYNKKNINMNNNNSFIGNLKYNEIQSISPEYKYYLNAKNKNISNYCCKKWYALFGRSHKILR